MSLPFKWTPLSIDTYVETVNTIQHRWTKREADAFEEKTAKTLSLIADTPEMFPLIKRKKIRRCVLSKQTTLYYKIKETEIELLLFWGNRKNPKKLKLFIVAEPKTPYGKRKKKVKNKGRN